MAYNQLITKSGHSLFTMSSLYQKAIRRCDVKAAGYAANELFDRYEHYLWKRTLVISAEDCYGECTQEILALYWASQEVNKGKKGNDRTKIFIAKAITILLYHAKSRDSDFFRVTLLVALASVVYVVVLVVQPVSRRFEKVFYRERALRSEPRY